MTINTINTSNKKSSLPILFKILVCLRAVTIYVPVVGYGSSTIGNFLLVGLISVMLVVLLSDSLLRHLKVLLPFVIFMVLDFIMRLVDGQELESAKFIYGLVQFFMWPLVMIVIIQRRDYRFAKLLLALIILCYAITGITTYIGCGLYPGASRDLAAIYAENDTQKIELYNSLNIGGFDFIYTLVLFCPLIVYLIRDKRNKIVFRLIPTILFVGIILVIIRSEYATAILCVILSLGCFFAISRNGETRLGLIILGALVVIVFFETFIDDFLLFISSQLDSDVISSRLEGIATMSSGYSSSTGSGDIDARRELYLADWQTFLESPIYGTGKAVGGHSFVLVNLAKYGLIGLFMMLFLFSKTYQYSIKPYTKSPLFPYLVSVFAIQILLAILNPLFVYPVFMSFIPLFAYVFEHENYR